MAEQLGLPTLFVRNAGLTIAVVEPACQVELSKIGPAADFDGSARAVLGFDLPRAPNTTAGGGQVRVFWLAPHRWLLVGDDPMLSDLAGRLETALTGALVSDVTHGRVVFEWAGPAARDLLAMGCALGPGLLGRGLCARTLFAGLHGLLYAQGDGYRVQVDRGFALHLAEWLQEAATALV
jgi:sarcosine oxidase subunit gamma